MISFTFSQTPFSRPDGVGFLHRGDKYFAVPDIAGAGAFLNDFNRLLHLDVF
jgi:hypothetical protein